MLFFSMFELSGDSSTRPSTPAACGKPLSPQGNNAQRFANGGGRAPFDNRGAKTGRDRGLNCLGDQIEKDMVVVRIGPDLRVQVVGSPLYFANRPLHRTLQDLSAHNCINLRFRGGFAPRRLKQLASARHVDQQEYLPISSRFPVIGSVSQLLGIRDSRHIGSR